MRKGAAPFFLILLLAGCAAPADERITIHYLPFHSKTFAGVTRDGITGAGSSTAEVDRFDPCFMRVMGDINAAKPGPPLEDLFIRAKLQSSSGWVAYIDNTGGVEFASGTVSLDPITFDRMDMNLALLTAAATWTLELDWAVTAAKAFVSETTDWRQGDYRFCIDRAWPPSDADTVVVTVIHRDDQEPHPNEDGKIVIGGGKSFQLLYDAKTRQFLRQSWYQ
jgi:hypothetical protein